MAVTWNEIMAGVHVARLEAQYPRLFPRVRLRMATLMEAADRRGQKLTLQQAFDTAVEQQRAERRHLRKKLRALR